MARFSLLAPIQAQLDTLSARDRKLLAGLTLFAGVVLVGLLAITTRSQLNDKATRVRDQRESLEMLGTLRAEYETAAETIAAAEAKASAFQGQTLSGFIEKTAAQVGVADSLSITRQGTETEGGVQQTRYKCEVKRVTYENVVDFIYELESSGYPLAIESARLTTQRGKEGVTLSATLEITHFELKAEG